jgi:hypothetical protein
MPIWAILSARSEKPRSHKACKGNETEDAMVNAEVVCVERAEFGCEHQAALAMELPAAWFPAK